MIRYCLQILLITLSLTSSAQQKATVNLGLQQRLESGTSEPASILVKGDPTQVKDFVERNAGRFITAAGDISSVKLSLSSIDKLLTEKFVVAIQAYPSRLKVMNDTMRLKSRVNEVHQMVPPLSTAYDGSGILMGFIDSGIDTDHPDFRDSLGNTRVRWLWDMTKNDSANTPQPYGYGQEWSAADIDAGNATAHTGEDQFGHGNYVAGIGAGNARANGNFRGVAPGSDIIVVCYDFNAQDTVPRVAHAIDYIFAKAQQLSMPCVINVSLGEYTGSHDGRDLESQFVSNLINQQPGRVVVAAAGNIGINFPFHIGINPSAGDTSFTWMKYNPAIPGVYLQVFVDSAQSSSLRFAVGADKVTPYYHHRGMSPYYKLSDVLGTIVTYPLMNGANRIGLIHSFAGLSDGVYSLEFFIQPDSTAYQWRFSTTGGGHFDSWSLDFVNSGLPSPGVFPPISDYAMPDTLQSIVSGIACLDNVITVGNYFNTDRHVDYNGTLQITPGDQPDKLAENSSRGPTRDGRIKPDICAPGHHIISTGVLSLIPAQIVWEPHKVAPGGFHVTGGGTSASAPVVAGIAALYLQKNPTADWQEVKDAMLTCAMHDQHTWGPVPNNAWGYGKADAFSTMTACGSVGIDDESAVSNNLYPNPADEYVYIETSGASEYFITDIAGRNVGRGTVSDSIMLLKTGDWADGTYFVTLSGTKENVTLKFSVKH